MRQIAILGRGGSAGLAPASAAGWERWGLAHTTHPADLIFEIHHPARYSAWAGHLDKLRRLGPQLVVQYSNRLLPDARLLPVAELAGRYRDWFACSIAYLAAWAAHQAPGRLAFFGCDLRDDEPGRRKERECIAFWMGIAAGRGVQVQEPKGWGLLPGPVRYS